MLLGGVVVDVLAAGEVVGARDLDGGTPVGEVALHPRLGARPSHRRGDPVEARVAADGGAMRAELARLGVVVLDRHVLEVGVVGDLELDDHVQVAGHARQELLGEGHARPALDDDEHAVVEGGALGGQLERGAERRLDVDAGRDVQEDAVSPASGVSRRELLVARDDRAKVRLDELRPLGHQPRDASERDAAGGIALDRQHSRMRLEGVRIEAAEVREAPRLLAIGRDRERLVRRPGSLAGTRQPGGLGRRRHQPTDPSICNWISRFISTAYSSGSSLVIGSMKPDTIIAEASSSERPRLIR